MTNDPRPSATRWWRRTDVILMALLVIAAVSAVFFRREYFGDYPYFVTAFRNMTGRDGLYVYHWMKAIQSGPVSLLAYGFCSVLGRRWFTLVVAIVGMIVVWMVTDIRRRRSLPARPLVLAVGGLVTVLEWRSLGTWGHLDDALALLMVVGVLVAHERRRSPVAAYLLGLSLAIKPWAVMFLPLTVDPAALAPGTPWRRRLAGPVVAMAVGGAFWLPFVIASPDTLAGIRPGLSIARDSVLHLVTRQTGGVSAALRISQLVLGMAAVTWTVRRGHRSCALLAGVAVRLLFEAATWPYYTAAFVLGAYLWDSHESRSRWPWATLASAVLLLQPWWFEAYDLRAAMRLTACLGALELVRRTVRRGGSSAERGADAARGEEDVLVEVDAQAGTVAQLDPAAV